MHRVDDSCFLHFIEPPKEEKLRRPINDEVSQIMRIAINESKRGGANYSDLINPPRFTVTNRKYKGYHTTDCGKKYSSSEYLLQNGMITNDFADFYLRYYRKSIPESEMKKVMELVAFYKNKYQNEPEKLNFEFTPDKNVDCIDKLKRFFDDY